MSIPPFDDEAAWSCWQGEWSIRDDTIYLNHGSFGPWMDPGTDAQWDVSA